MKRSEIISTMVKFAENSNIDPDSNLYLQFQEVIFSLWTDNIQDGNDNERK